MVQQVSNLAQQNIASPYSRGEQQQQQINQRQQDENRISARNDAQTTQTRRSGTAPAQSQNTASQFDRGGQNQLSVSEFRQQLGIEGNEKPPRGSLLDISI